MSAVTLKRIIKAGYISFKRNGWLTTATILVMSLVLFVIGCLVLLSAIANTVLAQLESKIDVTVYFVPDASEPNIIGVKQELEKLPDVKEIVYTSREEALEAFRQRHKNNPLITEALEEVGENPLEASLNVKAHTPSQYASISNFLLSKNYSIVDKINYFENQMLIERFSRILTMVRGSGAIVIVLLAFIATLVAFNTIRLAIYTLREEIGIMRLVGATSWFIRGPFLVGGVLYGAIAAVFTLLALFPLTWLAAPKLSILVPGFDVFGYFLSNFVEFVVLVVGTGVVLGTFSSAIAIRRYLQV
jgi:cell division transport system permease protein